MGKFIALLAIISFSLAQQTTEYAGDCGKLNENYLYNFKSTAANDEFPWIGRVYFEPGTGHQDRNAYRCLAVLISQRHLLIPAQCVAQTNARQHEPYAVILGADDQCYRNGTCPSPVPNYYEIDEIALHPNMTFDQRQRIIIDNNIGIITLTRNVVYNAEVRPICLPSEADASAHFVGQYLTYAGHAKDYVQPLKAVTAVTSLRKCRDMYSVPSLGDQNMCVVPDMKEETIFVAGAPLMGVASQGSLPHPHNFYLVGMAALGSNQYKPGAMDVMISVGAYLEWIKYNTAFK